MFAVLSLQAHPSHTGNTFCVQEEKERVSELRILAVLFGSLSLLSCLSLVALVHQAIGGNPQSILNLGSLWQSSMIGDRLTPG